MMGTLSRRGFLKGIFGAVALVAAAPVLRVADAVVPGPPPPKPETVTQGTGFLACRPVIKVLNNGGMPAGSMAWVSANAPVPPGWILCDGRSVMKGTHKELELALGGRHGRFPFGETALTFKVPDLMERERL